MLITILGATGMAGSRVADEALRRGHKVKALARRASAADARDGVTARDIDANQGDLASEFTGADVVVSAIHFVDVPAETIISAAKRAGVRLIVVGGAGSLYVAPGVQLVDAPIFPEAFKPEALAGRAFLGALRAEPDLDWSFMSPSAYFEPGERTGVFRIGGDDLLAGADGQSRISAEDFAIALLDEIETPQYSRQRFTVGY